MRPPRLEDFFDDFTGEYDYDAYGEARAEYEENAYDTWRDDELIGNDEDLDDICASMREIR